MNVFDERELELLIGGIADIDVEDWKKHTDYRGFTESDEVIVFFWKVWCHKACHTKFSAHSRKVHTVVGCRAEVASSTIRNWHVADSSEWVQGSARQRWAKALHD